MDRPTASFHDQNALSVDSGRRRSMRLLLSMSIEVSGKSGDGRDFQETPQTMVVNAHGALVPLEARVIAGQRVIVSNKATRESRECRIVHLGKSESGKAHAGIEFVAPSPSFWQINFPPDDWVIPEN